MSLPHSVANNDASEENNWRVALLKGALNPPPAPLWTPDKRIFVLLPMTVQVPSLSDVLPAEWPARTISMPNGRLAVQAAHVVSKMRVRLAAFYGYRPITTIAYGVRNSRELDKLVSELRVNQHLAVETFKDIDEKFYETPSEVRTAACTTPVTKAEVDHILGHLELFK